MKKEFINNINILNYNSLIFMFVKLTDSLDEMLIFLKMTSLAFRPEMNIL